MYRFILVVAVLCGFTFAQGKPKIAVYVTGDLKDSEKKALSTKMLDALVNSGLYTAVERSEGFLEEVDKEHLTQRGGTVAKEEVVAYGARFGADFVCIADITAAFGSSQISARIINVKTAGVEAMGSASGALNSMNDLEQMSYNVVKAMFGGKTGKYTVDKFEDFTGPQRTSTFGMNLLPGLGSFIIMKDNLGAAVNIGLAATGIIMFATGFEEKITYSPGGSYSYKETQLGTMGYVGLGVWLGGANLWSLYRALTYHKPTAKTADAGLPEGLRLAVLPDGNGAVKGYVAYSMEF